MIAEATERFVRERLGNETTGHDWHHTDRVRRMALRLASEEASRAPAIDLLVVELAALLHDVEDWKFSGDETAAPRAAASWLTGQGLDPARTAHVAEIVETLSFKGAGVPTPMGTIEGAIVQDADRLDAIGAIGIARTFAYGGFKGSMIHDPEQPAQPHDSFAAYRASAGSTTNHFYEKLLLLKDRMNTEAAKAIAADRHRYLEEFLNRFHDEWLGLR
jgi:uncharacterized protein